MPSSKGVAMGDIPVLETPRLRLRGHRTEDFPHSAAMWSDPVVVRHIGGVPANPQQSWARLLTYVGHWAVMGFGYWVVEEKASGAFIGEVGFADFKRDMEPTTGGAPELGWALVPAVHGKGFATEAVRAAMAWGDAHLGVTRTVCIIDPGNVASARVAAKCGFAKLADATYRGEPTVLYFRARSPVP